MADDKITSESSNQIAFAQKCAKQITTTSETRITTGTIASNQNSEKKEGS